MPDEQYLTGPQVQRWLRISRWTLARYRTRTDFPSPVKLNNGTYRWDATEIETWLRARKEKQ